MDRARTLTHPYFLALQLAGQEVTGAPQGPTDPYWLDRKGLVRHYKVIYTIFEGTSEIQHLIIARAISGAAGCRRYCAFRLTNPHGASGGCRSRLAHGAAGPGGALR